jgi:DNA-binding response OmpR family regulator
MNPKGPIRVLIVDDSPILLETIAFALSMRGFAVETAEDGIKGLERAVEMQPNCIIIDVKMPGLNGLQLVRVLRGDPSTEHIPLIILSAMVQEADQLAGMFSGADQYLMKPINPQVLDNAIHRAIALDAEARAARLRDLVEGEQ